jgi:hypothetical protein
VLGVAVDALSDSGIAVKGVAPAAPGLVGESTADHGITGDTTSPGHAGVSGRNAASAGTGVLGRASGTDGIGVRGEASSGTSDSVGVSGSSDRGRGVLGRSKSNAGVQGVTLEGAAVYGRVLRDDTGRPGAAKGVYGQAFRSPGVHGHSDSGIGVLGTSSRNHGVRGESSSGVGVFGTSSGGHGVSGHTDAADSSGVVGIVANPEGTGAGVYGEHTGGQVAGFFRGNVVVTGFIEFTGADCAEEFDLARQVDGSVEPGTVMVVADDLGLRPSESAYDRRVAGVVSGAGDLRPGVLLGRTDDPARRVAVALVGRVYCRVDATYGSIDIGDLLTTSSTIGHAMRAADPLRASGAVLGKALRPLAGGRALIPILVTLQ